MAASIIKDGEVHWQGTFGFANVKERRDIEPRSLFVLASISKTVFGMTLMQLVEDGTIDLDAPADQYTSFPIRNPHFFDTPVTVRQLATHTGGMEDDWIQLGSATSNGDSDVSLAEFAEGYAVPNGRFWSDKNWANIAGHRHSYSNAAFGVLGAVVEGATGRSLPDLAKERLFTPLDMNDTGWHLADVDESLLAVPYAGTWTEGFIASKHQGYGFYPATGLRSSIADMSRFLRAFMNGGQLEGTRVLDANLATSMHELQFPDLSRQRALVWRWRKVNGHDYLGHSGSTVGGAGIMVFQPDEQIGLILLTNSDAYIRDRFGKPEGADAMKRILDAMDRAARGEPVEPVEAAQ